MFWYILLNVLMALFALAMVAAICLFAFSGGDFPILLLVAILIGAIAGGCAYGASKIEEANTVAHTEVVEMKITSRELVPVNSDYESNNVDCYITVNNEFLIEVTPEEYAKLEKIDTVPVKIETKTTFSGTIFCETTTTASLG